MAVPPNLDPAIAKQVIEYLKANPEAAQQSYEQAHRMLQAPGMAQMLLDAKVDVTWFIGLSQPGRVRFARVVNMHAAVPPSIADHCCMANPTMSLDNLVYAFKQQNTGQRSPEQMAKMMELKEDPELKPIFDDIEANGTAAMEKYWNDTDLMSKISQKMSAMKLGPATPPRKQENMKVLPLLSCTSMISNL